MKNLIEMWQPERNSLWREFNTLQRKIDRFMDETTEERTAGFVPACDFEETENHYLISLDVPGMVKDQLHVELMGNVLRIYGEQKEEKREQKGAQKYFERFHGRFERSFTLPDAHEADRIEADYKDGVLRIAVPKSQAAKGRRIPVTEGKSGIIAKLLGKTERKEEQRQPEKAA